MADKHVHQPSYFFSTNSSEEKRNRYKRAYRHSRYCKHCGTLIVEAEYSGNWTKWRLLNCFWVFIVAILIKQALIPRPLILPAAILFFIIDYLIFRQIIWVTPSYLKKHRKR